MRCKLPICVVSLLAAFPFAAGTVRAEDGVPFPGPAISATTLNDLTLGNNTLTATFANEGGSLRLASLKSPLNNLDCAWPEPNLFTVHLSGGGAIASSRMKLRRGPEAVESKGVAGAARLSDRLHGRALRAWFVDEASGLKVQWTAVMTDGANYLRQELLLTATRGPVNVDRIELIRVALPGARVEGYTDGSPVVTDKLFLGVEHPMAKNAVTTPGVWTPAEMQVRRFDIPVTEIAPGEVTVRFDYQSGRHRIDVASVSLIEADGKKLSEDVHEGFSGLAVNRHEYRIPVVVGISNATLHVELGGKTPDETDSFGKVVVAGAKIAGGSEVVCALPRQCALLPGAEWKVSSGIGVYPEGQLRRAFLCYLERERAHPYRQYWHYNSWYDLNIGNSDNPDPLKRTTEAQCLDVIRAFGRELYEKRGVGLNGFVWDDGWDDWNSLWNFHAGFPNGFAKLKQEAAKQGAGLGAWLSPWGGYGSSHDQRVKFGREHGYEINSGGFSLGGENYFSAFRDVCLKMVREYNQNYFKFDGIGDGMYATGAPARIAPDLDGLVRLLDELRSENPDVFINCTVGTWASPYWTRFADSVWRQGADCDFVGEGNDRERWITYRDERLYARFAKPSPLYPLNSMMYHGLLVSPRERGARMPTPAQNFASYRHEVLMSVGCGSDLGELYVTPSAMTPAAWDLLADGLKWARARRDILCDTHWIGGNPLEGVYGYASWHPQKGGAIVLRNPTSREQTFVFDARKVFELPAGAQQNYKLTLAFSLKPEMRRASAGQPLKLTLPPFDVQVWEANAE